MGMTVHIYLNDYFYNYIKENRISPSNLFRQAIINHKNGALGIPEDSKDLLISKLQKKIQVMENYIHNRDQFMKEGTQ